MEQMKELIEVLKKQGKTKFFSGVNEKEIQEFEDTNNIKLPNDYKAWLQFSDGGECFLPAGVQFYGIKQKPIIDITDDDKPDETYTIIGILSTGDPILCKKDSEEIAIYNHEAGVIEPDEKYKNFNAFLEDLPNILGIGE